MACHAHQFTCARIDAAEGAPPHRLDDEAVQGERDTQAEGATPKVRRPACSVLPSDQVTSLGKELAEYIVDCLKSSADPWAFPGLICFLSPLAIDIQPLPVLTVQLPFLYLNYVPPRPSRDLRSSLLFKVSDHICCLNVV